MSTCGWSPSTTYIEVLARGCVLLAIRASVFFLGLQRKTRLKCGQFFLQFEIVRGITKKPGHIHHIS